MEKKNRSQNKASERSESEKERILTTCQSSERVINHAIATV